tara:strand:- start:2693 stop:3589 length:897 start_codon:yes stop_codon:yes gene_type:complete
MALVPATFEVDFTSQYSGNHRICWRLSTDPPGVYDCTTVIYCASGNTCNHIFNTMVDNETCVNVTYEGYVQPTCFDAISLDGRIPFSSEFIPDPLCKKWTITCNDGPVEAVNVQNGGSGYTVSFPVVINGAGTGATATANVAGGVVVSITLDTPGSGYISATADLSAGDGVDATALVLIEGCSVNIEGCTGDPESIVMPIGNTLATCKDSLPLIPATASVIQDGHCLCQTCTSYLITNSDVTNPYDALYVDCNTLQVVIQSIPASAVSVLLGGPGCTVISGSVSLSDTSLTAVIDPCA